MEFVSHPPVTPASPWMVWTELKIGKRQLDENIINFNSNFGNYEALDIYLMFLFSPALPVIPPICLFLQLYFAAQFGVKVKILECTNLKRH